ncbi:MAG: nucleotidyltransferase domain-containing protein [Candidatus Sungbacteria bacterium]|nr:nucleotidyltransferase domain-containing protein [Candidatus Sungbacteria bacterium]
MAFLFGSQAKGYARVTSDWDIGVYFNPSSPHKLELEEDRDYPAEHEIWGAVEKIVHAEVDLLVLNRAPASVADTAIRGVPLAVKDTRLWLEFLLRVTSEAIDFRKTAREYAEVY